MATKTVGKLKVDLVGNTGKFDSALSKSRGNVRAFKKESAIATRQIKNFGAGVAGVAGALGLGAIVKGAINAGTRISDLALQLRIGTTELQSLQAAAKDYGISNSGLERSLRNVQMRTQEAAEGNRSYQDAFSALNLNVEEFRSLSPEKQLEALAKAQDNATDKTEAYNAVAQILGQRAGPEMQEMLKNLAEKGFPAMQAAAIASGRVMDEETIQRLDKAADEIEKFKTQATVMAGELITTMPEVGTVVMDSLGMVGDTIGESILTFDEWSDFLGEVVNSAIAPFLESLNAMTLGFQAIQQAASSNFKAATASIHAMHDAFTQAFEDIENIPENVGAAYDQFTESALKSQDRLARDFGERSGRIAAAIEIITESFRSNMEQQQGMNEALEANNGAEVTNLETKSANVEVTKLLTEAEQARVDAARVDFENELNILRLRAQGLNDLADHEARRLELLDEAADLAERLNISEEEAQDLIRERLKLEQQATDEKQKQLDLQENAQKQLEATSAQGSSARSSTSTSESRVRVSVSGGGSSGSSGAGSLAGASTTLAEQIGQALISASYRPTGGASVVERILDHAMEGASPERVRQLQASAANSAFLPNWRRSQLAHTAAAAEQSAKLNAPGIYYNGTQLPTGSMTFENLQREGFEAMIRIASDFDAIKANLGGRI